jgi:hypothetical protein
MGTSPDYGPNLIVIGGKVFAIMRATSDHFIENTWVHVVRIVRDFVVVADHMAQRNASSSTDLGEIIFDILEGFADLLEVIDHGRSRGILRQSLVFLLTAFNLRHGEDSSRNELAWDRTRGTLEVTDIISEQDQTLFSRWRNGDTGAGNHRWGAWLSGVGIWNGPPGTTEGVAHILDELVRQEHEVLDGSNRFGNGVAMRRVDNTNRLKGVTDLSESCGHGELLTFFLRTGRNFEKSFELSMC